MDALKKCRKPGVVLKTLKSLPETLDDTYARILTEINEKIKSVVMSDAQLIVTAKRLGVDLRAIKKDLRKAYPESARQVTSPELKKRLSVLAESWLTDLCQRGDVSRCVSSKHLADLNVHFQRLLLFAERATLRRRYDEEIGAVLKNFTINLVIPLMQGPANTPRVAVTAAAADPVAPVSREPFSATAFVGHSFMAEDLAIANSFIRVLEAVGITVATGERPQTEKISEKIKRRIEKQHIFVGVFTKRDKLAGKKGLWSTSAWVIDEKAFASGRNKRLILLKEYGVESIGGIQGDYEYIEFSRRRLQDAILRVLQLFDCSVRSMRE